MAGGCYAYVSLAPSVVPARVRSIPFYLTYLSTYPPTYVPICLSTCLPTHSRRGNDCALLLLLTVPQFRRDLAGRRGRKTAFNVDLRY